MVKFQEKNLNLLGIFVKELKLINLNTKSKKINL
jgi:hypothetical protein